MNYDYTDAINNHLWICIHCAEKAIKHAGQPPKGKKWEWIANVHCRGRCEVCGGEGADLDFIQLVDKK